MPHVRDRSGDLPQLPFPMLQVEAGPHENFHYVVACPETGEAAIVDPAFELDAIWDLAKAQGWRITTALITHGHWDHIGGLGEAMERGVEHVVAHRSSQDLEAIRSAGGRARLLSDDGHVGVGTLDIRLLHTPGHQPEGSCYQVQDTALFGGDTLFIGSCGRTDFPGGDTEAMFASMRRLAGLDPDLVVFPGHDYHEDPWARLGQEKLRNPALATTDREAFGRLRCLDH